MKQKPDEKQLETLLEQIKPEPSKAFYEKMENAPWKKKEQKLIRFPYKKAAAIAILGFALLLFMQPNKVIAELIAAFFQVEPSESNITMPLPEPTSTFVPSPSPAPSLATLQENLSFTILEPSYLPEGYVFDQAYPITDGLIIQYKLGMSDELARGLTLYQSTSDEDAYQIGANAIVQTIDIDGVYGEYVQGNWETIESSSTANQLNIRSQWDNSVQMHMLVWEVDGVRYQLLWQAAYLPHPAYYGDGAPNEAGYLSLEDLIRIAASIH